MKHSIQSVLIGLLVSISLAGTFGVSTHGRTSVERVCGTIHFNDWSTLSPNGKVLLRCPQNLVHVE